MCSALVDSDKEFFDGGKSVWSARAVYGAPVLHSTNEIVDLNSPFWWV